MIDAEHFRDKGPIINKADLDKVLEGMDNTQLSSWFLSERTDSVSESTIVCRG